MDNKCINLKIRSMQYKKYFYCTRNKCKIKLKECKSCIYKEYKKSISNGLKKPLKQVSRKRARLERGRYSILTNDLSTCYLCRKPKNDLHEIFEGRNRTNSIKYGLVMPLCRECHTLVHNDIKLNKKIKIMAQKKFQSVYPGIEFIDIFRRNY